MGVVVGQVVGDPAEPGVHVAAAELLRRHLLAGRRLHQRRPGEEDRALLPHDDRHVRHRRHVGAAGGARPHHHRDLRDARRAHPRLVVEDPPEVVAVGKHLVLVRQVRPARVDEVDAGQRALGGDLLRPQVLLHRHRIVGAALHRGVVGDDHHLLPGDPPDAGDHPGARRVAAVHPVRRRRADLEERAARVEQPGHPLPRQHLAPRRRAAPPPPRPPPGGRRLRRRRDLGQRGEMRRPVGAERLRSRCGAGGQHRHAQRSASPSSARMSRISRSRKKLITERISTRSPRNSRSLSSRLSAVWMMSETISSSSAARM